MDKERLIQTYDSQAKRYGKRRDKRSGEAWRAKLFRDVKGKTLELAVGAGMNFAFFPKSVEYTGVDISPGMLEQAKKSAKQNHVEADFILTAAESLDFPEETFDTIVSSGSLCGYEDPVHVLNLMNKWCKKDGQILLLEHGLCSSSALAWLQKKVDPLHVKLAGCHLDRDILQIVKDSDLLIDKCERALGGYLYLIWARPEKLAEENGYCSIT